jgi:hypothetical protein
MKILDSNENDYFDLLKNKFTKDMLDGVLNFQKSAKDKIILALVDNFIQKFISN